MHRVPHSWLILGRTEKTDTQIIFYALWFRQDILLLRDSLVPQGLSPGLRTQISNCQFNMFIWICNRRLKINIPKLNSPMFVNDFFFFYNLMCSRKSQNFSSCSKFFKLNYVLFLKLHIKTISHPVKYAESISPDCSLCFNPGVHWPNPLMSFFPSHSEGNTKSWPWLTATPLLVDASQPCWSAFYSLKEHTAVLLPWESAPPRMHFAWIPT